MSSLTAPRQHHRRDFRRQIKNFIGSRMKGSAGCALRTSGLRALLATGGLLVGSVSIPSVAKFPNTSDAPSKAWRAAENSPICTKERVRASQTASSSEPRRRRRATELWATSAQMMLSRNIEIQSPSWNCLTLDSSFLCETVPPRDGR